MSKIKSGSVIVNPTDLLQGNAVDSILDRASQLYSHQAVTWTGTSLIFTQPINIKTQGSDGLFRSHRIRVATDAIQTIAGQVDLANEQVVICRISPSATTSLTASAVVRATNIVTVTAANNLEVGDVVTLSGFTSSSFNGTFIVASATSTQFTFAQVAANDTASVIGTITANYSVLTAGTYSSSDPYLGSSEYALVSYKDIKTTVLSSKDHYIIAHRKDNVDGIQTLLIPLHKQFLNAGQSVYLGASGSGSGGGGTGDDLNALLFRASFLDAFDEGPTDAKSSVDVSSNKTDPTAYNAAKGMYTINYDASKTVAVGTTTTNLNISASASFTVKIGDIAISGSEARRITAVASQSSFTTEVFSSAPALSSQVTISQVVYTKDIYNFAVDGSALSAAFGAETFSEILVDYEDTTTVGDNIFDVNTTPVIAFSASPNGTSFTNLKIRPTLETDEVQSVSLPSAGTGLYLRFFAYKTSGSGSVNVLRYKAFMQKSQADSAGGVLNSSYAMLNGTGTPYQCSLSVVSGKTVITLPYQYAVGVNPGSAYGSLDVYVNGQLIPRYIDASTTPDASFIETASNVLTLDQDYSSFAYPVEVVQKVSVIDNSSTNTTAISDLNEIFSESFQPFVSSVNVLTATSTAGTPAAGRFYSSISNRKSIPDLTSDLMPRMGTQRILTQRLYKINDEYGADGKAVFGVFGDKFNQIRFVGKWRSFNDIPISYQGQAVSGELQDDYVEVTFYGTGLNWLTYGNEQAATDVRASVDGGAEGSDIAEQQATNKNATHDVNINVIVNAVCGLPLGVHTVKLRLAVFANGLNVYGFEILNESANVIVQPGTSYSRGKKLVSNSVTSFSYNAPVTGTKGGRVVVFQKIDGTIDKLFQACATSPSYMTSTDHSNEELINTLYWRQFSGSNYNQDWNSVLNGNPRAYTMDDGTTTLLSDGAYLGGTDYEVLRPVTTGNYLMLTFVGTGLDITRIFEGTGTAVVYDIYINGTLAGSTATTASLPAGTTVTEKIASGLPYGTHTIRFVKTATGTVDCSFLSWNIYQPKTPTIPTGSTLLGTYNVMANFIPSPGGQYYMAQGVLRKSLVLRESVTKGTWLNDGALIPTYTTGFVAYTNTASDKCEYTFWGTGFEINEAANAGWVGVTGAVELQNLTDGGSLLAMTPANFPTLTTSTTGGYSYVGNTWSQNVSTTAGSTFAAYNLPLKLWKVVFTSSGGASFIIGAFDIITPIHSEVMADKHMNKTFLLGSCGMEDKREFSPIKDADDDKSIVMSNTDVQSISTNLTYFIPLRETIVTINVKKGKYLEINFEAVASMGGSNSAYFQFYIDGKKIGTEVGHTNIGAGNAFMVSKHDIAQIDPGIHTVAVMWRVDGSAATLQQRQITVKEI